MITQDQQVSSRVAQVALDMPYHSTACTLPDGRDTAAAGASRTKLFPSGFIGQMRATPPRNIPTCRP
jgi:hypothetical protein